VGNIFFKIFSCELYTMYSMLFWVNKGFQYLFWI
jgi:hypothetical protein